MFVACSLSEWLPHNSSGNPRALLGRLLSDFTTNFVEQIRLASTLSKKKNMLSCRNHTFRPETVGSIWGSALGSRHFERGPTLDPYWGHVFFSDCGGSLLAQTRRATSAMVHGFVFRLMRLIPLVYVCQNWEVTEMSECFKIVKKMQIPSSKLT